VLFLKIFTMKFLVLTFLSIILLAICCKNVDAPQKIYRGEEPLVAVDTMIGFLGCDRPSVIHPSPNEALYQYQHFSVEVSPLASEAGERIQVNNEQGKVLEVPKDNAPFFAGIRGNHLFVDRGTGPDGREIVIYDLSKRGMEFQGKYTDTVRIVNNQVWIWEPVATASVTKEVVCPNQEEWTKNGLQVGYAQRTLYHLVNRSITRKSEYKCVPEQ
jgi:hypothetical protein